MIGDATDNGNIQLSIIGADDFHSNQALTNSTDNSFNNSIPIRIESGTKNIILARKLDKESVEGESSVTIGVRCRPKRSLKRKQSRKIIKERDDNDYSNYVDKFNSFNNQTWPYTWTYSENADITDDNEDIIIPIRILVTDANDNKPEWQGTVPYSVNISEMAAIGSVVLTGIRAVDNDQLGPFSTVEYYVEPGPYSHLLRFASPLEGTLILSGQLDYETLPKFWISIRAQDQGNPPNTAMTKVNVQVIDADDQNPRFEMDKYTAILGEALMVGQPLIVKPKPIKAEDPDRGMQSPILYQFNSKEENSRENSYFKIDSQTGEVSLKQPLHSSITLPITLVIRATQMDNQDRYALTTLTIVSKRDQVMPELRFLHSNYSTSLLESTPPGQVALTVQTTQPSATTNQQPLRFQILDDDERYFEVNNNGEILLKRMLDYEKHHRYSFRLMVTDGRQTDLARITIQIMNVNEHDPVFGQSAYVFHVNEARLRSSSVIGQIEATDADDGDRIQLSLTGPHAAAFALSTDGILRLRSLRLVNSTECHMIAMATDSGSPPRTSSTSVVVKFAPALIRSLTSRTLESLLFELEQESLQNDLSSSPAISPTAVDILQHSASNIFSASTNSSALVLVIVLGVLLGTLFIIIVALTLHVLKNRKYESRPSTSSPVTLHERHQVSSSSSSTSSSSSSSSSSSEGSDFCLTGKTTDSQPNSSTSSSSHNNRWSIGENNKTDCKRILQSSIFAQASSLMRSNVIAPLESENNEYNEEIDCTAKKMVIHNDKAMNECRTDLQPDSAISSDLSCWSENKSSQSPEHKCASNTVHSSSQSSTSGNESGSDTAMGTSKRTSTESNGNGATVASRISVIRWPQGSIPRRVKKLTWKDEQKNNHLDQLYAANTTMVNAKNCTYAQQQSTANTNQTQLKTKTLGGHLLTGNMSMSCASPVTPSNGLMANNFDLFNYQDKCPERVNMNTVHAHYHVHEHHPSKLALSNGATIIRHHQTPHYPLTRNLMDKSNSTSNQDCTNKYKYKSKYQTTVQHHQYQHSNSEMDNKQRGALPDLTVYF